MQKKYFKNSAAFKSNNSLSFSCNHMQPSERIRDRLNHRLLTEKDEKKQTFEE